MVISSTQTLVLRAGHHKLVVHASKVARSIPDEFLSDPTFAAARKAGVIRVHTPAPAPAPPAPPKKSKQEDDKDK